MENSPMIFLVPDGLPSIQIKIAERLSSYLQDLQPITHHLSIPLICSIFKLDSNQRPTFSFLIKDEFFNDLDSDIDNHRVFLEECPSLQVLKGRNQDEENYNKIFSFDPPSDMNLIQDVK